MVQHDTPVKQGQYGILDKDIGIAKSSPSLFSNFYVLLSISMLEL